MAGEQAADDNSGSLADPRFVAELRRQMLKFATLQLGDSFLAEDAVQEAFAGALKGARAFRGAAALRSWVFAILKNKIADTLRQRRIVYEGALSSRQDGETEDPEPAPAVFDARDHWPSQGKPVAWGDPESAFQQSEFWRVFATCLDHLPPRQARVLMMREVVELEADEICQTVGMTLTNLHVTLHRARLRLRECLEDHWFEGRR